MPHSTDAGARFPAVFLDRDGTLMEEVHYCKDPNDVRLFPGVRDALARLKKAGFKNIIITNQSGIGRGHLTEAQYRAVEVELLAQIGPGLIDATYFCPDAPSTPSTRRKPQPGMVLEAAADHHINLAKSYFIGDKTSDIDCGRNAGTHTILVHTGYGAVQKDAHPDFAAKDIVTAADFVLKSM